MNVDIESMVHDAPPPKVVLRIVNPLIRFLLRTPAARSIGPLALVDFRGRHTGQRRRVVVGWHLIDGNPVVLTPAAWRLNFTEGRLATVRWRGRDADYVGTLETNSDIVADAMNTLLRRGSSARSLALRIPAGHTVNAADISATRRALIRFQPVASHDVAASPQPGRAAQN
jgi:hypothetical protein